MNDRAPQKTPKSAEPKKQGVDSDQIPSFSILLRQFKMTMEAVLEVVEALTPHVESLDQSPDRGVPLPPMSEEGAEKMRAVLEQLNAEGLGTKSQIGAEPEPNEEPQKPLEGDNAEMFMEGLRAAYEDQPGALRAVGEAFQTIVSMPQRQHLLHASLLTMAVGTLETAIAGVSTQHYALHPEALPAEEKEFSLAELAGFDDLQDARIAAISRRVEDLMRSGFDAWDKWFEGLLQEGFDELAADRAVLNEAVQRRHIVVHNGGRVSRQYLAKVPGVDAVVGEELRIDRAYLEAAIDAITIFGLRLILTSWSKWAPEDDEASGHALDLVYEQLVDNRNEVASCVAETALQFPADEKQRLSLRVNHWQARKRIEGLEAIRDEVEAWDTSALSPLYRAAKPLLLDDFDTAFATIPELIAQEDVNPAELREWPLFKEAREHERWVEIEALLPPPEERTLRERRMWPTRVATRSGKTKPATLIRGPRRKNLTASNSGGSGAPENRMGSDATPNDVRLSRMDFIAVLEGCAAVVGPGHLPDTGMALHALHAKSGMKALFLFGEIGDELSHRIAEFPLLLWTQLVPVAPE